MGMDKYGCFMQMYTILPKVLGRNKARFKKKMIDSVSVEELDRSA